MILEEKKIKYSIITKDGKKEKDLIKIDTKNLLKILSLLYIIFSRIHDTFKELDIKLSKDKHFLLYPYKEERFLAILTEKPSQYEFVKEKIKEILNE